MFTKIKNSMFNFCMFIMVIYSFLLSYFLSYFINFGVKSLLLV
ncbi:putative membrane protein [Streptococcus mitis]|uniref:Putative membrane protein n=1 Tax=Streptococcus mitis TaxID=28037 RepID=A0A081QAC7_STRMT|nr:putative membrane protein [Streptococcus mitis]